MDSKRRALRTLLSALVGFVALAFAASDVHFAAEPRAALGASIDAASGIVAAVVPGMPAAAAGLAAGDRIVLDRLSLRERLELVGGVTENEHEVAVTVARAGVFFRTALRVVPSTMTYRDPLPAAVRTVAFALEIGLAAVLLGASGSVATFAFFGFILACAPTAGALLASTALPDPFVRAAAYLDAWSVAGGFLLAVFFARTGAPRDFRFFEQLLLATVAVAAVGLALGEGARLEHLPRVWITLPRAFGYVVAAYALIRRLFTTRREEVERMRWIAAASLIVFAAHLARLARADFGHVPGLGAQASGHLVAVLATLVVAFPIVVAFAVLTPNLEELPERVVGRSSRTILAVAVGLGFAVVCAVVATLGNAKALFMPLDLAVACAVMYGIYSLVDGIIQNRASGAAMSVGGPSGR